MSIQRVIMIGAVLLLCLFEATTSMSMKGRLEDDTTGFCMSSNKVKTYNKKKTGFTGLNYHRRHAPS